MLAAVLAFDDVAPPAPSIGGIIPLLTRLPLKGDGIKGLCLCHAEFVSCLGAPNSTESTISCDRLRRATP
jgi:hypothetical protein